MRTMLLLIVGLILADQSARAEGDAGRGAKLYQNCNACHALEPNRNLTGPSLSGVIGRKAGGLESFSRYSDELKSSGLTWNDKNLDAWLADPQRVVPGNHMTFPGIRDPQQRSDIIAFLKRGSTQARAPTGGGMMGGMTSNTVPNLKKLDNASRVEKVQYCKDTYEIVTADGSKKKFWERNLRFKTDGSEDGPTSGSPALVPAGMMGDRADVIFAAPSEFGKFVAERC